MKTIAFFNVKGGVGKTTSAINVAYELSLRGYRVLVVDLDAQSNLSDFFQRCGNTEYTVCDLLSTAEIPLDKIAVRTEFSNIDIIPAYLTLGRSEKLLMSDTTIPQQFRLKRHLMQIADRYDFCILDCSPNAENLVNINGLACADFVYVPLKCDKWAMCGLSNTIQVINAVSTYNDKLRFGGTFFVQWESRNINRSVYDMLQEQFGEKLLPQTIRKNKLAEESSYQYVPVKVLDKNSTIAQDYAALTDVFLKMWR